MDPVTHALASFLLARAFFPRRPWPFVVAAILAGTLADIDLLSVLFGPALYLSGRLTITHSLFGTLAVIFIAVAAGVILQSDRASATGTPTNATRNTAKASGGAGTLLVACALMAVVHVLLDVASTSGVAALWPFRSTRYALDWLPSTDGWILTLLGAGIFVPELFRLVTSEIGAKEKSPRGRNGALIALAFLLIYVAARASLHASAIAQLDAHTYQGESAHRSAAFPDTLSLTHWHGITETTSSICAVDVPVIEITRFDPERAACVHKPEASLALNAAQQTASVRQFLQLACFPRASLSPNEDGTTVVIRDAKDAALGDSHYAVAAEVQLDRTGAVISQHLAWAHNIRLH